MKNKKRIFSLIMAGTTAASLLSPMTVMADDETTTSYSVTSGVATVAAHRAAETAPMILGANLITTGGVNDVMLELYGDSTYNEVPNEYLHNYILNNYNYSTKYAADGVIWKLGGNVAPTMADLIYGSVYTGADIFLGNAANSSGDTYESYNAANGTSLYSMEYKCSTIEEMEDTMVKLAVAIDDAGDTLYTESAKEIAADYVNYIEGTVKYVSGLIAAGTIDELTVAYLSQDSSGEYYLHTVDYAQGTSINRAAEYLDDVTTDLADVSTSGLKSVTENGETVAGYYEVTDLTILLNADAIITTGFQGSSSIDDEKLQEDIGDAVKAAYIDENGEFKGEELYSEDYPDGITTPVFNTLPDSTYGIYMNSAENALGMVALILAVYDDSKSDIGASVEDAVAYYYSHFYHIKDEYVDYLADSHFYRCINYDAGEDGSVSDFAKILK